MMMGARGGGSGREEREIPVPRHVPVEAEQAVE